MEVFEFFVILVRCEVGDGNVLHYTNVWIVKLLKTGGDVLDKLRIFQGFEIMQNSDILGLHLITHKRHPRKGKYENKNLVNILFSYEEILWAEQISVHRIELRFARCPGKANFGTSNYKGLMNDRFFTKQWYLHDCRTNRYHTRNDLNVLSVWHRYKIFGAGVKVIVNDSGTQIDHPDLKTNFDPEYGYDFVINHHSPTPKRFLLFLRSAHGTECAGIIAMQANNKICGVGVAPLVTLGAARISSFDRESTILTEARGLLFKAKNVDVSNNSWGPTDNGKIMPPLDPMLTSALKEGIVKGRRSKGVIYVFASGNGSPFGDTCAHDCYANSMYTITVAGVQYNGDPVYYSERCSNVLVAAYSGGSMPIPFWANIVTTTNAFTSCTSMFCGTSAATPLVSGIVALILEANSELSWREVQHVFAWTSQVAALAHNQVWFRNAVGFYFSLDFGFGLADAFQAVTFAKSMLPIPTMNSCVLSIKMLPIINDAVFNRKVALRIKVSTNGCKNLPSEVNYIEHVQLLVSVEHPRRGAVQILLISPSGTQTLLMDARRLDTSKRGLHQWILDTVHLWGESPEGVWSIIFYDRISRPHNQGIVTQTVLLIHGTKYKPAHYDNRRPYYKFT